MADKNDKPAVNFVVLQSVEDYVEKSGKFRTNCASFRIPGRDSGGSNTVYIPYCEKQRFDFGQQLNDYRGHGVFKPPEIGKPFQIPDFVVFREHFHDIHCPRPCRGYRNKTVVALFDKIWSGFFGAKLHQMPADNPSAPPSVLKQAINAVPAVKYALGVGGIISVIAIVRGFGIDFRVAFWGTVVMLVLMTVLLVFAKASSRPQSAFKGPAFILTWFSLVLFMATATALFLSVFFGTPLDLRTLLAPVHAGQTPVEKHGTAEVLPPTTDRVDVTVKQAPSQTVTATVGHEKKKLRTKIGDLITEGTKIRNRAPVYVGTPIRVNGEPDVMAEWTAWTAMVEQFLNTNFDPAEVAKFRSLDDPNTSLNSKIHGEIAYLEQLLDKVGQESHASTTTTASGSIVNNGGVINNPTISNAVPPKAGMFELTEERRNRFLKLLSAQTASRETVRIGCTSWSEKSCVAAGRFLLLFSEAGWQIEENKVFRMEPQIPIVGVAITTRAPADEPKEPLPPHLGRWRAMDESHKNIYWAFRSLDIPVGGATDNTLKDGTLGIYFGSEPQ
jgi:hypothetical protein